MCSVVGMCTWCDNDLVHSIDAVNLATKNLAVNISTGAVVGLTDTDTVSTLVPRNGDVADAIATEAHVTGIVSVFTAFHALWRVDAMGADKSAGTISNIIRRAVTSIEAVGYRVMCICVDS